MGVLGPLPTNYVSFLFVAFGCCILFTMSAVVGMTVPI